MKTVAALSLLACAAVCFAAPPAGAALTRGPYLQNATPNAITIRWRTDTATSSRVWVGAVPGGTFVVASDAALKTEHELRLTGLVPGTTYYYAVGSTAGRAPGADASWRFVTPPPGGAAVGRTRIWVLGDSGTPSGGQRRVRDAYYAWTGDRRTDVWLMLGDIAYENGTDSEFQAALFEPYASFLRGHALWSTRGNHDEPHSGPANDYFDLFTLPTAGEAGGMPSATEAWYSFDHGNIHFVCLDSQDSSRDPGSPMLTWLAADLATTRRTWVIAFWHHPPYSKGSHDSDDDTRGTEMRENVMPILEQFGVDLVLAGHSHSYERSYLIDRHYGFAATLQSSMILDAGDGDVSGDGDYVKPPGSPGAHQGSVAIVAGGSSTLASGALDHPAMARSLAALGSVVIDVNGSLLEAVYLDDLGAVRDRFAIRKGTVVDSGPGAAPALRLSARSPVGRGPVDFAYALPGPGPATLTILDATGRRIRALALGPAADAGPGSARWDGNDAAGHPVAAGVYFARLEFGDEHRTARVVVVP